MHHLGETRSAHRAHHLLQTPDTFVRAPLPGLQKAVAIVHTAPGLGAQFAQYTVEFEAGGSMAPASSQRFLYVLEGELELEGVVVPRAGFAYSPNKVVAKATARVAVIEKAYQPLAGVSAPKFFIGHEGDVAATPLAGDDALEVRCLVPDHPSFDFAVNIMTYLPGAALPFVEIHVMEHGLLMLEGGGIYRLGEHWYPVAAGDFIWMAPYCPQWFGALGKAPAKYLIYKDWNRGPRL
jgi:(S)-ureidoglycine aminohydrolase